MGLNDYREGKYYLGEGTVQCVVARGTPFYMFHFGRAEYDRDKPILSESIFEQAQPIVDALNAGTITEAEAEQQLSRIYF